MRGSHGDQQHECSKKSSFGRRGSNVSGGLDDRRSDGEHLANLALIALAVMLGFGNDEQRRREQDEGKTSATIRVRTLFIGALPATRSAFLRTRFARAEQDSAQDIDSFWARRSPAASYPAL